MNLPTRAQKEKNDEYYTTYKHVEYIFNNYLKNVDFTDKIIYCFCDSEESNFVKYLKDNKERLKYKDLWYTWDDYNNHVDLFEKADYVITNPPFSKLSKDLDPLIHKCKNFFLFGNKSALHIYFNHYKDIDNLNFISKTNSILETDYEQHRKVETIYFTNIKDIIINKKTEFNNTFDNTQKIWCKIKYNNEIINVLNVDKVKNIPIDYEGYMFVPVTIFFTKNAYKFNIIKSKQFHAINDHNKELGYGYSDGKSRYVRVLIKNKPEYLVKN